MKKISTVTIGIPTYNEQENIKAHLNAVLAQQEDGFRVTSIIVVDGGSDDNTAAIVRTITDPRIQLIAQDERTGQNDAQNIIFSQAKTDIVVLLEADTLPQGNSFLKELVSPLLLDHRIGLVQGNGLPCPAHTAVGRAVTYQFQTYHHYVTSDPRRARWYSSGRGGRAFARIVYLNLRWPPGVPEDVYALIWCRDKGIRTYFTPYAINNYQTAQTYTDFMASRQKMGSGRRSLYHYFPIKLVQEAYYKPRLMMISVFFHFLFMRPHLFALYSLMKLPFTFHPSRTFVDLWPAAGSTKRLVHN